MALSNQTNSMVPEDHLHDDVAAVAQYRSVSKLAVFALLLGVASLLALLSPSLIFLALFGVIISPLALRRVAASEGELIGRWVAIVGLVLSLAVGAGLIAQRATVERLVAEQATPWAQAWCDLVVAGKHEIALELTRPVAVRRPLDETLIDFYTTDETARQALETFKSEDVVKLLSALESASQLEFGEVVAVVADSDGGYQVLQSATLLPPSTNQGNDSTSGDESDAAEGVDFQVQLKRTSAASRIPGAWLVSSYILTPVE